jgi:hypothetical protein
VAGFEVSALPLEIVRANFSRELPRALDCAQAYGWEWTTDLNALTIRVALTAQDGQRFILCGEFDDYKAKPPFLEFEEPDTGLRGTTKAYPTGHDSFFHSTGPCICAPFSRKAYKDVHTGWRCVDWTTSTESNVRWSQYSTMAGMVALIHSRLTNPAYYLGRMG